MGFGYLLDVGQERGMELKKVRIFQVQIWENGVFWIRGRDVRNILIGGSKDRVWLYVKIVLIQLEIKVELKLRKDIKKRSVESYIEVIVKFRG